MEAPQVAAVTVTGVADVNDDLVADDREREQLVLERLEDQLTWYDARAASGRRDYQVLKIVQIVVAAAIPVASAAGGSTTLAAILGGIIVVVEALQQLFQFQQNWTRYRSTAEGLRHEKYLYRAKAGPYASDEPRAAVTRLAETTEALVSKETSNWASLQTTSAPKQQH